MHSFRNPGSFYLVMTLFSICGPEVSVIGTEMLKIVQEKEGLWPGLEVPYKILTCILLVRIQTHDPKLTVKETGKCSLPVYPEGK